MRQRAGMVTSHSPQASLQAVVWVWEAAAVEGRAKPCGAPQRSVLNNCNPPSEELLSTEKLK